MKPHESQFDHGHLETEPTVVWILHKSNSPGEKKICGRTAARWKPTGGDNDEEYAGAISGARPSSVYGWYEFRFSSNTSNGAPRWMNTNNSQVVKGQVQHRWHQSPPLEMSLGQFNLCPLLTAWHLSVMLSNLSFRSPRFHNILHAFLVTLFRVTYVYLKVPLDSLPYQHFITYTRPYFIPHTFLCALFETFVIYVLSLIAQLIYRAGVAQSVWWPTC
jgi:hypothetical protein